MNNNINPRYFSLEEANAILPVLRLLLEQLLQIRQEILNLQPQVWPALAKAAGNGGNQPAGVLEKEFARLDAIVRQIQATGAILKDLNIGLLDFLSLRGGREIYLCWRYGEAEIYYWHDLDAGYGGRQPL
jgi:hypothetical protein